MKNKLTIILLVGIILGAVSLLIDEGQKVNFNQGYQPVQPINFSHKVHAGENKINCLYCHFAAEKGRHAGIPPVELCMNCHKKIRPDSLEVAKIKTALETGKTINWIKVNHFPDFAYFNHSQHVKVGKVNCQECHGPIESMTKVKQVKPLNMGWCLDCHRSKGIAAPNNHKSSGGGDCAKCHY